MVCSCIAGAGSLCQLLVSLSASPKHNFWAFLAAAATPHYHLFISLVSASCRVISAETPYHIDTSSRATTHPILSHTYLECDASNLSAHGSSFLSVWPSAVYGAKHVHIILLWLLLVGILTLSTFDGS
ncbi:hypothetical protein BR93DRAFT_547776 [Coniochaeta sp. PMI_546]|nr:hypothetical protein BR93DRAFT_547776 [Coniochaeta sp. PMI_546]